VSREELAAYPACPSCRFRTPPGLERCPRCRAPLPRAGAVEPAGPAPRLGEYLMRRGVVGPRELRRAADRQRWLAKLGTRRRFGEVLVEMGLASLAEVEEAAARRADEF